MKIGDEYKSIEIIDHGFDIEGNPIKGLVTIRVWDCCDFCEIELKPKDVRNMVNHLISVYKPDTELVP